ncbi:MAG: pyridoxal-phosphate dependent enzyme, partial [Patescibacteria group bacterium]
IKKLDFQDILRLTHNKRGFDITSNDLLNRTTIFYDWLSFEIINNNPDYILCPFGTGELYENICNVLKREAQKTTAFDPRLQVPPERLGHVHVIGGTVSAPSSIADKLYAPHLPFTHFNEQWLRFYRDLGYVGKESGVFLVQERFIKKAYQEMTAQGIKCEPSGAAGLAYLMQHEEQFPKQKRVVIVNTGRGLILE